MLIRKDCAIVLWLLLIGWFAPPPLLLRGDDGCSRALPSYSVQYAARFYKIVSRILENHRTFENISIIYGELFVKELKYKIARVRGMAHDIKQADEWQRLLLQNKILQCLYFMASQAVTYYEAYTKIRAENGLETQLADAQLSDENYLDMMLNIQDYYKPPVVNSEILNYELLTLAELPLEVFLKFNSSDQQPELIFELRYPCTKFLYEPDVAEGPLVAGYFRTPVECHRELNALNDYVLLLHALQEVACEFNSLANRSITLTYSDYFRTIVPPDALAHAQMFVRNLFADLPSSDVDEYKLIVATFLRILMDFLYREYEWQRCHPILHLITKPLTQLWTIIDELVFMNLKSYESAYVESRNLQNKTDALYEYLTEYNLQVGFTLRADVGAAIADGKVVQKAETNSNKSST